MTNRLRVKSLLSIGAVEEGDNPEADILFWKSKKTTEPEEGLTKEGDSMPDIESLDAAKARISELEEKLAEFDVEAPAAPLPEDLPDAVAKRLDDQDAAIAKAEEEKIELAKKLAAIEDERATEKYTKMAEAYAPLLGDPAETAPILKSLGTSEPEALADLETRLEAGLEKAAFSELLKEYGSSDAEGPAVDQIVSIANEIRKESPDLSLAEAKAEAWRRNPDLKTRAREEGSVA